jgi:methylglutaconyl-CoA hydratase
MTNLTSTTINGPIATLTLERAEARNALSLDLLAHLHYAIDAIAANPAVHVLLLTGSGKAFCAGMDLKAVLNEPGAPAKLLHSLADFTLKLRSLPAVTIAKVNGAAIGGGCGLSCVCDIAITHADSKMGYPEVDLGVCPAVVAPWLVKKIGPGRARRVLLQGGLMSGQQAFDLGMVDHVVPTLADLDSATETLVQRLSAGAPHALRATKKLLNEIDGSLDASLVKRGADLSAQVVMTPETRAMLSAKLTK